jgi:hypothetical protein
LIGDKRFDQHRLNVWSDDLPCYEDPLDEFVIERVMASEES